MFWLIGEAERKRQLKVKKIIDAVQKLCPCLLYTSKTFFRKKGGGVADGRGITKTVEAAKRIRPGWAGRTAFSYTHLDVYKRQAED